MFILLYRDFVQSVAQASNVSPSCTFHPQPCRNGHSRLPIPEQGTTGAEQSARFVDQKALITRCLSPVAMNSYDDRVCRSDEILVGVSLAV